MLLFMGVSLPVFAIESGDSFGNSDGVLTVQRQLFAASQSSFAAIYFFDDQTKTITLDEDGYYSFESNVKTIKNPWLEPGYYIDFTFSIPSSGVIDFINSGSGGGSYLSATLVSANDSSLTYYDFDDSDDLVCTLFIDDVEQEEISISEKFSYSSYPVNHHVRIRLSSSYSDDFVFYESINDRAQMMLGFKLDATYTQSESPSDPTDPSSPTDPSGGGSGSQDLTEVIESIEVVQGHLEEINGNIVDIKDSVEEIEVTVKDTHDQLENPDSNIWQAAGSAISNAVTGLFVPDKIELEAKIAEVEDIITDKLGDTYEVIERVDQYEDQLVSSFTDGGDQYNFHFPGISVPLPDGLVTILPEQDVNIENDAFIVFRDLLGIGVALLCGFSAVHIAHDFVICIISGVSYWGFIRGRHDK